MHHNRSVGVASNIAHQVGELQYGGDLIGHAHVRPDGVVELGAHPRHSITVFLKIQSQMSLRAPDIKSNNTSRAIIIIVCNNQI